MKLKIVKYIPSIHDEQLAQAIRLVNEADPTYPPRADVDGSNGGYTEWLSQIRPIARFVGIVDDKVIGHCGLSQPASYMTDFLARQGIKPQSRSGFSEVTKLFIRPDCSGKSFGEQLLKFVLDFSQASGYVATLAVVETSQPAIRLYLRMGLASIGEFTGRHGRNFVFMQQSVSNPNRALN